MSETTGEATTAEAGDATPAGAVASPDADLLRLLADLRREQALLDRWNADDGVPWAEGEAANARWWEVVRQIIGTEARTAEGVRAKAEAVRLAVDGIVSEESRDPGHQAALALVSDVLRLVSA